MNMRWWTLVTLLASSSLALAGAPPDPKVERLWRAKCASCHGDDGKGQTDQGKKMAVSDMSTAEWQQKFTDEKIKDGINNGVKQEKGGVKQEMDAYKTKLRPEQVDSLVAYTRSLKK
jgi:mono/diheme cytochrome c family protein